MDKEQKRLIVRAVNAAVSSRFDTLIRELMLARVADLVFGEETLAEKCRRSYSKEISSKSIHNIRIEQEKKTRIMNEERDRITFEDYKYIQENTPPY